MTSIPWSLADLRTHENMLSCCSDLRGCAYRAVADAFSATQFSNKALCFTKDVSACRQSKECKVANDNLSCRPVRMHKTANPFKGEFQGEPWRPVMNSLADEFKVPPSNNNEPTTFDEEKNRILPIVHAVLKGADFKYNYKPHIYKESLQPRLEAIKEQFEQRRSANGGGGQMIEVSVQPDEELFIFGDLHGQHTDLKRWWGTIGGTPDQKQKTKYVFLGDYVDRGDEDIELVMELLDWQERYPERVILLRGNHESKNVTSQYGFKKRCTERLHNGPNAYKLFMEIFDLLPVSSRVHVFNQDRTTKERLFCCHGGISPQLTFEGGPTIEELKSYEYKLSESHELVVDITWSDPSTDIDYDFTLNDDRLRGCLFGPEALKKFCTRNEIDYVIRGHQHKGDSTWNGYDFPFGKGHCVLPRIHLDDCNDIEQTGQIVTVFSAPNYMNIIGNSGAVMKIKGGVHSFELLSPV